MRVADGRPGRVGGVDLGDLGAGRGGLGRGLVGEALVVATSGRRRVRRRARHAARAQPRPRAPRHPRPRASPRGARRASRAATRFSDSPSDNRRVGRQARSVAYSSYPQLTAPGSMALAGTEKVPSVRCPAAPDSFIARAAAYHRPDGRTGRSALATRTGSRARPARTCSSTRTTPSTGCPWGPDALARAKLLDRPIFLSIGYAACHWCHVMERESFEDEATAAALNARLRARSRSTARSAPTSTSCTWAPSRR